MITMERRNKNANKTKIDWDLNIFIPEELDAGGESYWDHANWRIHVYHVPETGHLEWDEPLMLTAEEIRSLGLNYDEYFKDEVDTWYGLYEFKIQYWDKMSDRLKQYFDALPRYYEDLI